MSDLKKPTDPFSLIGDSWPSESESAYHTAKVVADDAATIASTQAQSARDAESRMSDEQGKTASAVSSGYGSAASDLQEESITYTTVSAWMTDAEGKIRSAKTSISDLVSVGTVEVREALDSEVKGVPATPSSSELIAKYQGEIASVKTKLGVELDAIGHSLHGDPGASRTPSYTSVSTRPTPERADPHAPMASYTGTPGAPVPEPHQLPEMPRATTTHPTESVSATSIPSTPTHSVNPTLANLIGGQGSTPTGTPTTSAPHTSSPNTSTQSRQAHQSNEQHQAPKPAALPRIPSIPLDGLPAAAAESVATAVSAATGHQLPTTTSTTITPAPSIPASTGITPGVPGTPPMTPMTPAPLTPIGGGGGLSTPPAVQPATPAPQGTHASPSPAPQQTTRGPAADLNWIQQRYGLAPGIETPKSENVPLPALFIADLPESEALLHRVLATIRQQFETSGWSQPLAVATLKRSFETRCVYVTADALSIHPAGILLPIGVIPLDEIPSVPTHPDLSGSIMVTDKLASLIPCGWEIETLLSTLPADEHHQSAEQYQELSEAGELLPCKVSRGRSDVTDDEALRVFARAAIGSAGCSDLDTENNRIRAARWVGVQPVGYGEVLARWYLSDAAESMSLGNWSDAVYASEKYMDFAQSKSQAA